MRIMEKKMETTKSLGSGPRRPSIEKRLFGEGGHRPAKVARTDDRRSKGALSFIGV